MKKRATHKTAVIDYAAPAAMMRTPWWNRRGTVLLAAPALLVIVVAAICGVWAIEIFFSAAADVATVAVWFALAGLMGAGILRLMRIEAGGALRLVSAIALGLGIFSLYALGLGLGGWLNRWTTLALALLSVGFWGVVCVGCASAHHHRGAGRDETPSDCGVLKHTLRNTLRGMRESADGWLSAPARWGWLWLVAVPFLAIAIIGASMLPGFLWKVADGARWVASDPHPYDVMIYHLQIPREWFEAGRITPLPHNVYCFFPFGMEMQYLLAMYVRGGPWAAMYLAQFLSLGCMVLGVVGVYGAAKEATEAEGAGTIAGVIAATVPWLAMLGSVAYIESAMLMYSVAALGWTIRGVVDGHNRLRAFALAGLMAGFACGTKYTAVPTVLIMFPAAAMIVMFLRRHSERTVGQTFLSVADIPVRKAGSFRIRSEGQECPSLADARQTGMSAPPADKNVRSTKTPATGARSAVFACAIAGILGMLGFSPWLIRNFAWAGNPVFPMEQRVLGQGHFDDVQTHRWDTAHTVPADYRSATARIGRFSRTVLANWQFGWLLVPAAAVVLAIWIRRPAVLLLAILFLGQIVFWLVFTHLQPRFAILLIPIGAVAIGACLSGRFAAIGAAVVALAAVAFVPLEGCLASFLTGDRLALIRFDDYAKFFSKQIADADRQTVKVALVGECQPFFYPIPMKNLRYRTVFDIRFPDGVGLVDGWLGESLEQLRRNNDVVIIHPGELRRMSSTYADVPKLRDDWRNEVIRVYQLKPPYPSEWADPDAPVVLPP